MWTDNRSGVQMLFKSPHYSASSLGLKKQKHYQTPGIQTMVEGSESLFVSSCHKCSTYLCDDVADKTTMGTIYSLNEHMVSFTVRNCLEITIQCLIYLKAVNPDIR